MISTPYMKITSFYHSIWDNLVSSESCFESKIVKNMIDEYDKCVRDMNDLLFWEAKKLQSLFQGKLYLYYLRRALTCCKFNYFHLFDRFLTIPCLKLSWNRIS